MVRVSEPWDSPCVAISPSFELAAAGIVEEHSGALRGLWLWLGLASHGIHGVNPGE